MNGVSNGQQQGMGCGMAQGLPCVFFCVLSSRVAFSKGKLVPLQYKVLELLMQLALDVSAT